MIHQTTYLPGGIRGYFIKNPKSSKMWDCIMINLLVRFRDLTGAVFTLFHSHLRVRARDHMIITPLQPVELMLVSEHDVNDGMYCVVKIFARFSPFFSP